MIIIIRPRVTKMKSANKVRNRKHGKVSDSESNSGSERESSVRPKSIAKDKSKNRYNLQASTSSMQPDFVSEKIASTRLDLVKGKEGSKNQVESTVSNEVVGPEVKKKTWYLKSVI
jgi:hypothetical protein